MLFETGFAAPHGAQQIDGFGRANCSPVKPATKRPPRISPCASMRRSTGQQVAPGRCDRFSRQQSRGTGRPSEVTTARRMFADTLIRRHRRGRPRDDQRPASGGMARACGLPRPSPRRRFGIDQRAQILEAIGGDQSAPQSVPTAHLPLRSAAVRVARTRSAKNEAPRLVSASALPGRHAKGRSVSAFAARRIDQPVGILAQEKRDRRDARGPTRRGCSLNAGCGERRAHTTSPERHSSSRYSGLVIRDAARQEHPAPRPTPESQALQLADNLQRAVGAVKLRARRHVLPARKEAVELRGRDRFDFAAQAAQRQTMDPRQNAPVAPFDLAASPPGDSGPEEPGLRIPASRARSGHRRRGARACSASSLAVMGPRHSIQPRTIARVSPISVAALGGDPKRHPPATRSRRRLCDGAISSSKYVSHAARPPRAAPRSG